MILYLDTSDLVKLYVQHEDSFKIDTAITSADVLASSRFTYVEVRATLASSFRAGRIARTGTLISREIYEDLLGGFERHWRHYLKINLSATLLRRAGEIAALYNLSGSDSVQLSSALVLRESTSDEVRFSVSDIRLRAGAVAAGFVVV